MIKNTKRIFALVLAFAVVAMSMFTGFVVSAAEPVQTAEGTVDLLEFGDYLLEAGSSSKYYDTVLADKNEAGTEADPIIIDNAEEFVYLCKAAGDETKGKYYKVADDVAGFDLSKGDLDLNGTLADNIDKVKASGKNHSGSPAFQGYFDGNGVTVYGAWTNHAEGQVSTYAGLFTTTKGEVTIKNTHVKFASFTAKSAAGGIVGIHDADSMCTLTIENCSVTDSHLEITDTGYGTGVGAIIGFGKSAPSWKEADKGVDGNGDGDMSDTIYVNVLYNVKNCYINLDETYFISKGEDGEISENERICHGGVVGVAASNAVEVRDCVVIGIKPYSATEGTFNDVQHTGLPDNFKGNVYTTSDVQIEDVVIGGNGAVATPKSFVGLIFPLSDEQLKGAAALENLHLDWSVWMADADGYPQLRNAHKNIKFTDNGNGTHGEVCDCGFGGVASSHIWANNECACGAQLNCAGKDTIYWDIEGSVSPIATGSGTSDDPYVIKSASEFAWLIKNSTAENTAGKYYEIASNIGKIVLQPQDFAEEILALDSAEAVRDYFENDEYAFTAWPNMGWEQTSFSGHFDGNGATVYGLYQVSPNNAGLFSTVEAGAVIKNIGVKNSYITSTATNYQVAAIAPISSSANYGGKANGVVWINNIVVANNYLYNSSEQNDRSGVVVAVFNDALYLEDALVYGNIALDGLGRNMPLVNSANNAILANDAAIVPDGVVTETAEAEIGTLYYNKFRNCVVMGAEPYDVTQAVGSRFNDPKCFENVYTDAVASTFFANIGDDQIKTVTVGELATLKLGEGWLNTATYPELAAFHDTGLAIVPNNNGTHGSVCSCGAVFASPCNFVDGTCDVCGAKMNCASKRTIYWNGGVATGFAQGNGTKDDPYIINSAEELAYLVSAKADVTAGKYFEMADDIGTIVLQPQDLAEEIKALDSAAAVQEYFENDEYAFAEWVEKGWEASCFAGDFDGKGVKIYGLYTVSDTNAGLFSTVDAGAAIHNIAVLNSYIYSLSSAANYQVGAIAAVASNGSYGTGQAGLIWFDSCIVGNCYMRNNAGDSARSGVIFGAASSDSISIDNCLVYGNDAKHGKEKDKPTLEMSLYANVSNGIVAPAVVPEGLDAKTMEDAQTGNTLYYNTVRNTISFGANIMNTEVRSYRRNDPGCFENNYTDAAAGEVTFDDGGVWTYEETQIKSVTLETLNENELSSVWVKVPGGYPELKAAHIAEITDNGDGTHSVSCPCGAVTGEAEAHNFIKGACDVCGAECAHVAGEAVEENRKEPSCEGGNGSYDTVVYCTVCGGEISRETTTIPGGHVAGEAIEENRVDATCSAEGSYDLVVYCTVCEEEISRETVTIEKLAHTHADAVEENRVEATCVAEGSYDSVVYCSVCGEEISRTTETIAIDENAHAFDDEFDTECNNGCGYSTLVYGDVNGDGEVNAKDCALVMQHITGWDVKINLTAADVNGDGIVSAKDYAKMVQFINGWGVTLG